jgi:hypothetical protein
VYPEIARGNLRRCLLLCDRIGFQRATAEAGALRGAAREYMVLCAPVSSSFHAKVWLLVGEDEAALLVGSGNLTQSGFMDNVELFEAVRLQAGGPHREVARDVSRFLSGLRALWGKDAQDQLLGLKTLGEMRDAMDALAERMPEERESDLRFLSSFQGPLRVQFRAFCAEGATVYAAAPYFGGSTSAVESLQTALALRQLKVFPAVHDGLIDIRLAELVGLSGVSAQPLALGHKRSGFAHLKLYGFDSDRGQWLFTGSANCTEAALGGQNIEAGLMRRVTRATLESYFAADGRRKLPEGQKPPVATGEAKWLVLWATDRGSVIDVVAADGQGISFPLCEVELSLQLGSEEPRRQVPALFGGGRAERLPWDWFPHTVDRAKVSPLLRVRGRAADGTCVEGAAFVDHALLLSSDPIHRTAWRAALALLDREGLPEAADLASVFHLVHEVFDTPAAPVTPEGDGQGARRGRRPPAAPEDKVPFWPPVPDSVLPPHFARGSRGQAVLWFQRILTELLHDPRSWGRRTPAPGQAGEDGDSPDVPARTPRLRRAARSAWDEARGSYEQLITRLGESELTAEAAPKIWPVSVAILLLSLATRRQILRQGDLGVAVPAAGLLVGGLLRALFADRSQPWRHGLAAEWDDLPTDPSVAWVLNEAYAARPADDLADVLLLLFAFQHARLARIGHPFPLNEWLLFRELAPARIAAAGRDREDLRVISQRYLEDETGGSTWEDIALSLEAIRTLGWADHPGFQELGAIVGWAQRPGDPPPPGLPPRLRDTWTHLERRVRSGRRWRYPVRRFDLHCPAPDCPTTCTVDPKKRFLKDLRPVICGACGAALIPDRLANALEEVYERVPH